MRKSKLESYEDILEALVNKPLTIDQIAYETNMNCTVLKQRLDFLAKNSLIEERGLDKTTPYAITERGIAVLKTLHFQKYLGKITDKISVIDETLQIIQELEKRTKRKKSGN
jgi:predicted transcriptional regulator